MGTKVYGAFHKDDRVRCKSSSGGVFAGLAECVIDRKGVVFGAKLLKCDGKFECKHVKCQSKKELQMLQGSKYIPSKLGDVFNEAKSYLENDRYVLFCGTPCQVSGLLSYLDKRYEKLYVVDFICHGIPTPHLLEKVIEEEKDYEQISDIKFRNKIKGWENYSFLLEFSEGEHRSYLGKDSKFMKLYLSDMYLRPSCYKCQFKGIERRSDITLGDFWGVNYFYDIDESELQKGISVVLIHSKKGEELLHLCNEIFFWESDENVFDKTNIYLKKSVEKSHDIHLYKYWFNKKCCEEIIQIYDRTQILRQLLKKIKRKYKEITLRGYQ